MTLMVNYRPLPIGMTLYEMRVNSRATKIAMNCTVDEIIEWTKVK